MNTTESIILADPKKVHISTRNTRQPKKADVTELVKSIRETGQITPALARPHPKKKGEYELAAGARRKVACEILKRPLRLVIKPMTDAELEDTILVENLQREDPDPMQEAALIQRRIAAGVTPSEIAARYGKSETWLKRRMKLASLTPAALDAWCEGGAFSHFTVEMMEFIGTLPPKHQDEIADDPWDARDYGSLKELVESHHRGGKPLEDVEWLNDPASFVDGCGPGCASNSAESLFPDPDHPCGTCTNKECFHKREALVRECRISDILKGKPLSDFALVCSDGYADRNITYQDNDIKILAAWETREAYTIAKKPTAATVPAIDFKDAMHPRLVHLLRKNSKKATAGKPAPGQAPTATEAREDRLTAKRLAAIQPKILATLEETPAETVTARFPILHLVAAFGLSDARRTADGPTTHQEAWGALYAESTVPHFGYFDRETKTTREDVIWKSIIPILRCRIAFQKNSDLLPEHKQHELRQLAALIGFPWGTTWETICRTEVPPPKSWGPNIDPITLQPSKISKAT
jgi:ParB/RepB/Spo0J family partition protein